MPRPRSDNRRPSLSKLEEYLSEPRPVDLDLSGAVGAETIHSLYQRLAASIDNQLNLLAQYPSTPYTSGNADVLRSLAAAVHEIGAEVRDWHLFLHPRASMDGAPR